MAKRWYSVSVLSNFEKKIAEQIRTSASESGLEEDIDEVLVPTEEVIEVRRGKKVTSERRFMPGYVLVHMEMSDDAWHLVKEIPNVMGFIGNTGDKNKIKPVPITDKEADTILMRVQEGIDKPRPKVLYEPGELIRVTDGPFNDFNGVVERWIMKKTCCVSR